MGLKSFSAIFGFLGIAGIFGISQPIHALEIGHVKSIDFDGEAFLDVKVFQNDKAYDLKIISNKSCNENTLPCLHSVKAFIDGQQFPVKAIVTEADGRVSVKAIRSDGSLIDIKSSSGDGSLMDVKVAPSSGSIVHPVKAYTKNGAIFSIKGIHQSGEVYDIKAFRKTLAGKTINGVEYMFDIKAVQK